MPPSSLFKARPKSDRRIEWRNLKADHADVIKTKKIKVEIGLGKELDSLQKYADQVVKLEGAQLTPAAFAPLLRTAAKVKQHVETLEPRVKDLAKFDKFLKGLTTDVAWWEKVAREFKTAPARVDVKEASRIEHILENLQKAKAPMAAMDTLLKGAAVTETITYEPPRAILDWSKHHKAIQPHLAKLAMLGKNPTGNHALILPVLRTLHEPIDDLVHTLVQLNRSKLHGLNAPVDWSKVKETASDILLYVGSVDTMLGKI